MSDQIRRLKQRAIEIMKHDQQALLEAQKREKVRIQSAAVSELSVPQICEDIQKGISAPQPKRESLTLGKRVNIRSFRP